MSGTPMTPERLAEIAVRAAHLYEYVQQPDEADVLAGTDVPALLARVAELEAERHSTNEALSDAAEQLRADRDRIAELEAELYTEQAHGRTLLEQRNAHAQELLRLRPRVAELEAAPTTVYRAEHDTGVTLGHYATATAARAHCEDDERRKWAKSENPSFDWIEDEEEGVAEMTIFVGGEECATGYTVTALEIPSEYVPGGDAR